VEVVGPGGLDKQVPRRGGAPVHNSMNPPSRDVLALSGREPDGLVGPSQANLDALVQRKDIVRHHGVEVPRRTTPGRERVHPHRHRVGLRNPLGVGRELPR